MHLFRIIFEVMSCFEKKKKNFRDGQKKNLPFNLAIPKKKKFRDGHCPSRNYFTYLLWYRGLKYIASRLITIE